MTSFTVRDHIAWRESLPVRRLTEDDQLTIERELAMCLSGYRLPAESIVGYRVLREADGYADFLLLRRDTDQRGFSFDLDVALNEIPELESQKLREKVQRTVELVMERAGDRADRQLKLTASDREPRVENAPAPADLVIYGIKSSLLIAFGATDLALERVNEIVATLRERAGEARTDAATRIEESRARVAKLEEELPAEFGVLRDKLTSDELRKFAEGYAEAAQTTYTKLIERGEAALERLRNQPALEEAASRVEEYTDQAVELTQEALGNVASQTRAVGERAAKLVGVELPKKAEETATPVKKAAEKAPAKAAPAKKAPVRNVPAKKVPAKKLPAKNLPVKKVAAEKKSAKVSSKGRPPAPRATRK